MLRKIPRMLKLPKDESFRVEMGWGVTANL